MVLAGGDESVRVEGDVRLAAAGAVAHHRVPWRLVPLPGWFCGQFGDAHEADGVLAGGRAVGEGPVAGGGQRVAERRMVQAGKSPGRRAQPGCGGRRPSCAPAPLRRASSAARMRCRSACRGHDHGSRRARSPSWARRATYAALIRFTQIAVSFSAFPGWGAGPLRCVQLHGAVPRGTGRRFLEGQSA
jgi:hypothetical protein